MKSLTHRLGLPAIILALAISPAIVCADLGEAYPGTNDPNAESVWLNPPYGLVRYTPRGSDVQTIDLVQAGKAKPGAPSVGALYIQEMIYPGIEKYALAGKYIFLELDNEQGFAMLRLTGSDEDKTPEFYETREVMHDRILERFGYPLELYWQSFDDRVAQVARAERLEIYVIASGLIVGLTIIALAITLARWKKRRGQLPLVEDA